MFRYLLISSNPLPNNLTNWYSSKAIKLYILLDRYPKKFMHEDVNCIFFFIFLVEVLLTYNSHLIQITHLKCTNQWFFVYLELCKNHRSQFLNIFFKKKSNVLQLSSPNPLSAPSPQQPPTYFLSLHRFVYSGHFI